MVFILIMRLMIDDDDNVDDDGINRVTKSSLNGGTCYPR